MEQMIQKKAAELLEKMETEGKTLKEIVGVDEELLDEIYSLAFAFYQKGQYKESLSLFHFLLEVNPEEYNYAFGLASSYYQLEDFDNALMGYFLAMNLDQKNPTPVLYIAECALKQGKVEGATDFLKGVVKIAGETKEYESVKKRAQEMLHGLGVKNNLN